MQRAVEQISKERSHNHPVTGTILLATMKQCPACLASMEEARELVRLAAPLYKELLSSIPFYQARMHDDKFWSQFVGSRVTEARDLVAAAEAKS